MSGRHRPSKRALSWTKRTRIVMVVLDVLLASGAAIAVTNWTVGLDSGSSGHAQSASISNLAITATSSPAPTNLLYPGSTGDVVITISNPNTFPVTLTALNLPTNTTYAAGFSNTALTTVISGCAAATPSGVTWNYSTGSSGTSHTLTSAVTIAAFGQANNPLVVTLTNDASMATTAPLACAGAYFSMPSFTGVSATSATVAATTSPTTSSWTS